MVPQAVDEEDRCNGIDGVEECHVKMHSGCGRGDKFPDDLRGIVVRFGTSY